MRDLDQICFKDFIQLHHICPKIYMLKCDKDADFSKQANAIFEPDLSGPKIRDHLVRRAKQRQI